MAKKHKDESTEQVAAPAPTAVAQLNRRPIKVFLLENVSASIFMREHVVRGVPTKFYSVSFTRSYKDSNGTYRYAKSFDLDDLGRLVTVVQQASESIRELIETDTSAKA